MFSVWHALHWGDVPTWLGSGAAGAAFWFAARVYRGDVRNRRRDQARSVYAYLDDIDVALEEDRFAATLRRFGADRKRVLFLGNAGQEPAYQVVVLYVDSATGKGLATDRVPVLPPGQQLVREIPDGARPQMLHLTDQLVTTVGFTDGAGIRWDRDWRGRLRESPNQAANVEQLGEPDEPQLPEQPSRSTSDGTPA